MSSIREKLEEKQISVYLLTIIASIGTGLVWDNSFILERAIEPVIGILLYSMFCQIPFLELKKAFKSRAFFKALLFGNFILIPLLVWTLISIFPTSSLITLGILLVLLTPCIDYVIIFSQLGKGDYKSVLASTPLLFFFQLLLLPIFLWLFMGQEAMDIIDIAPFVRAFLFMIVVPFLLSVLTQMISKSKHRSGRWILNFSGWMPVPLMALTFFVIITSQVSTLYKYPEPILHVLPVYICFALTAPLLGKLSARIFKVDVYGSRAIAFSTSTRNSLVVLPLALALPAPASQLVAVVIVTQTIVEIIFEIIYIKLIPKIIY